MNWKIFQLIPKYFEAFNTNEYFTGLNLVSPITCLYRRETLSNCICVCQPYLQRKRECNFRNLLLKIIRHSFVIMLLSVVCVPMCFLFIIIAWVSLCCFQKYDFVWDFVMGMKIVNTTLLTSLLDSRLQNWRVSDVSNQLILIYNMWVLFPYHLKNMLSNCHIFYLNLQF